MSHTPKSFPLLSPEIVAWCLYNMTDEEGMELTRYAAAREDGTMLDDVLFMARASEWLCKHKSDLILTATPENCAEAVRTAMEWNRKHNPDIQ